MPKRPNGYWDSWEHLKAEVKIFLEKNPEYKELPSSGVLFSLGYSTLVLGVSKNGGFREVRKRFGHTNGEKVLKGKWRDIDFTISEAKRIMQELEVDYIPEQGVLVKKGYSSFCNSIYRYHGGFSKFRKLFGQKSRNSPNTWLSLDSTLQYARDFLREHPEYDELPSVSVLRNLGEHGFVSALYEHHGGFEKFRRLLEVADSKQKLEDTLEKYVGGRDG